MRASTSRSTRKLDGTMPLAAARVHAFGQHVGPQRADQVAAQRRRAPQLVVVAALGVEADDEARCAERGRRVRRCAGRGRRCRFLRWLRSGSTQRACGDALLAAARESRSATRRARSRRRRRRGRTACRRATPAFHGSSPSDQPVNSGCLSRCPYSSTQSSTLPGTSTQQHRRATRECAASPTVMPWRRVRFGPALHQLHRRLHVAVRFPVGIEQRRLVRDPHVLDQLRQDRFVPGCVRSGRVLLQISI